MAALVTCKKILFRNVFKKNAEISLKLITTSSKKKDVTDKTCSPENIYQKIPDFSKPSESKNWVSFGFDYDDKKWDTFNMHLFAFATFTIAFCGVGFSFLYAPGQKKRDWIQREAFIRLYEREELGLEPIDPNYVDPQTVTLPPDKDLEEEDIII